MLLSPSSLCSPHNRPVNPRQGVEARNLISWLRRCRLVSHSNHLLRDWIPSSFVGSERSNDELKSEGRIERRGSGGSKVKESSILQNISKGMASLGKVCVNLLYSQVGRATLSMNWTKALKFTYKRRSWQFTVRQRGRVLWVKLLSMIIIQKQWKESQRNSFQHGVILGFFSAMEIVTPAVISTW